MVVEDGQAEHVLHLQQGHGISNKNDIKMLSECLTLVGKPVKQFLVIF